ncbi:hypothetical protein MTO96_002969 [Rhipicephalus appendiculatus]
MCSPFWSLWWTEVRAVRNGATVDHSGRTTGGNVDTSPNVNQCGDKLQSPVDLDDRYAEYDSALADINFNGYDQELYNPYIVNNGHTVQISATEDSNRFIEGARLPGRFQFAQFHLHWGANSSRGSEHTVRGFQYPLELHFVHFNAKYGSAAESMKYEDGLAVVAVYFEVSPTANEDLSVVVDALKEVRLSDEKGVNMGSPVVLSRFLPRITRSYYRYQGSLTTPPCSQAVTFLVMTTTVPISEEQLQQFRLLRTGKDENSSLLVDNFRPTFPLNGRRVFKSFPSSAPGLGPEGFPSLQDADDSYGIFRESGFDDRFKAEIPREVMVASREMTKGRETLPETIVVPPGSPVARPRVRMTETAVRPPRDVVLNTMMTTTTTTTSRDLTAGSRDLVTAHEMTTIGGSLPETIVVLPGPAATHHRVPKTETGVHPPPDVVPSTATSREVTAAPRVLVTSRVMMTIGGSLPETIAVHPISPVARPRVLMTETVVHPLPDVVPNTRTTTRLDVRAVATKKASEVDQSIPETPPILFPLDASRGHAATRGLKASKDPSSSPLTRSLVALSSAFPKAPRRNLGPDQLSGPEQLIPGPQQVFPIPEPQPFPRDQGFSGGSLESSRPGQVSRPGEFPRRQEFPDGSGTDGAEHFMSSAPTDDLGGYDPCRELASVESLAQGVGEVVRRCNYVRSFVDWPRHSRVCAPIWNAFRDPLGLTTTPPQPLILPPSFYENPATEYYQLVAYGKKKRK